MYPQINKCPLNTCSHYLDWLPACSFVNHPYSIFRFPPNCPFIKDAFPHLPKGVKVLYPVIPWQYNLSLIALFTIVILLLCVNVWITYISPNWLNKSIRAEPYLFGFMWYLQCLVQWAAKQNHSTGIHLMYESSHKEIYFPSDMNDVTPPLEGKSR